MRWEDPRPIPGMPHRTLCSHRPTRRLVILGDFNQIIGPGSHAPQCLQSALLGAFPPGMTIVTAELAFGQRKTIDHIALSEDLVAESLEAISNIHESGNLSDHFGVYARLSNRPGR